jgi:hypothetical protein
MKLFRWSTVMTVWLFAKPYLIQMTRDMAADYAGNARK